MNDLPRGLRNRNPGNIRRSAVRYKGETEGGDAAFKSFRSMAWGYRAMFVLLHTYSRNGYRTLRQMISRYAPPVENHTERYIRCVAEWSGTGADAPLDTLDAAEMISVVAAMSRMENGKEAVDADVREGWRLFMQHRP